MSYGVKYSGSVVSLDGITYTAEILKNGYSGAVSTITLAAPGIVVRWGEQGADIYEPIRPSSAEIMVYDKNNILLNELLNADEEMFRLRIKKGASVYWTGKILTNIFEGSLDVQPGSYRIAAVDGLGQLEGIGFLAESRVSVVQTIAEILKLVGLDLNIRFSSNWFTPEILSSDDPLAQIYIERSALRGDNDTILSNMEALRILLTRFGLQLHQSDNVWWVIQRELLYAANFRYYEYDKDGVFVTSIINYNPAVTITEADQYSMRLSGGRRPFRPPFKTATVFYFPKADTGQLVPNGDFEQWENGMPAQWSKSSSALRLERFPVGYDGSYSAFLGAYFASDEQLPPYFIEATGGVTSGATQQLRIRVSARASVNPNRFPQIIPIQDVLKLYFSIRYGDYWLRRDSNGALAWVHQDAMQGNEDYLLFRGEGLHAFTNWETDEIITPPLPIQTGQITVRLYQLVEPEFTPGQESTTAPFDGVLWDAVRIEPVILGESQAVVEGVKTVAASLMDNKQNRDALEFSIGDGPSTLTRSRLTVGAITLTGNWKKGAYGAEPLSGKSIDAMLAETLLAAQKQPLEVHQASYYRRSNFGIVIEAHQVLVIGTKRFAWTSLERSLLAGRTAGEWVEIRSDDFDIITSSEAVVKETGANKQRRDQVFGDNTRVGSQTFSNTIPGAGWEIRRDPSTGRTRLTIDEIVARHFFTAGNLIFKDVQVHGGELMVTDTGPAIVREFSYK